MGKLAITMACGNYDRTRAIQDGRVEIEGCDVNFLKMGPEELFFRAYGNQEFDVCELSMSSYLLSLSRGVKTPYLAIPVFISRTFRHSAVYIRTDRNIKRPEDLRGKKMGVPEYQITAALWVRAMLDGRYGVGPADIDWYQGGLEEPGRTEKITLNLPDNIRLSSIAEDTTLDAMLSSGQLDALIAVRPPSCFKRGQPDIARLFPNYIADEAAYFTETGIFPIMHVIGIRRSLLEAHPWLANSLYSAFVEAKKIAVEALEEIGTLSVTLPWLAPDLEKTRTLMGKDYWPYGVEENRTALEAMVKFAHRHGTAERLLEVDELFAPSTLKRYKI